MDENNEDILTKKARNKKIENQIKKTFKLVKEDVEELEGSIMEEVQQWIPYYKSYYKYVILTLWPS